VEAVFFEGLWRELWRRLVDGLGLHWEDAVHGDGRRASLKLESLAIDVQL